MSPDFGAFTSVRGSQHDIHAILAVDGVVAVREHPGLRGAIEWRLRTGELTPVLPGVYAPVGTATSPRTRIAAVARWDPDAVLTHEAAAAVSFWSSLTVPIVRCSVRHRRTSRPGFEFSRDRIPAELVWRRQGLQLTSPALTALDLCSTLGGDAIDQALRTRSTTLALMRTALELTARRTGNPLRRELLFDSREEPWSEAERRFHRLLRAAGITGWSVNRPLYLGSFVVYPDVVFRQLKLVVEIDGRGVHSDSEVFESDRQRQNALVLRGWRVLRVTWRMIQDEPVQVMAMVREAIAISVTA